MLCSEGDIRVFTHSLQAQPEDAVRGNVADIGKVSRQIAADLHKRFPDARAELFLDYCGMPKTDGRKGCLQDVLRAFCQHCSKMVDAWVRYEPDHAYGSVCTVVGHCGKHSEECERMCKNYRKRPRALLILTEVAGQELAIGGTD